MSTVRTTVNLPKPLLQKAKVFAAQNQVTLTSLIQDGLNLVLSGQHKKTSATLVQAMENLPSGKKITAVSSKEEYRKLLEKEYAKSFS